MAYMDVNTAAKSIRQVVKRSCPRLSIRHGSGTAYGWIEIRGSGRWGEFTDDERRYLVSLNLNPGGNLALISPDTREYWHNKIALGKADTHRHNFTLQPDDSICCACGQRG